MGKTRRAPKTSRWSSREAERVAKARQNPDCMAGCDFRGQNDAQKTEKTSLAENEKEGVNASIVLGKRCRAQKTADDAAYSKTAFQKQGAIHTA